jgi:hypothetical protein
VNFSGLIALLVKRALELEAADPTLFLRVVGIDATPQDDFRAVKALARVTSKDSAKYADQTKKTGRAGTRARSG